MGVLWLVEVALGFALSGAFVLLYGLGSSDWRRYAIGMNLLAKSAILTVLFALTLAGAVVAVPAWAFVSLLGALDVVLAWRLVITWRVQHSQREWLNGPGKHVQGEGERLVQDQEVPGRHRDGRGRVADDHGRTGDLAKRADPERGSLGEPGAYRAGHHPGEGGAQQRHPAGRPEER